MRKGKDLRLRDAEEKDRAAIREVTLAAYQEYAARMPAHWGRYREGILSALSDVAPAEQVVAERNGVIVGTVLLYPSGTLFTGSNNRPPTPRVWPEMRLLAVPPAARGEGIGRALVEECIRRARRNGAAVLTLHTSDAMQTAMQLYERMGFVRAPELDFHPAPDLTVKGYRFDLAAPR
ncbi:MAG TPA: GNAT family N-acetyltransferase [Candidatus Manganitrophaceae bacterium]|nr:GNAT family N-acetyltransferase [Candidatus Manganitrophaceae bacterium]